MHELTQREIMKKYSEFIPLSRTDRQIQKIKQHKTKCSIFTNDDGFELEFRLNKCHAGSRTRLHAW